MSAPDTDAALVNFALYFARHGLRILPIAARSKRPALKNWPVLATTDAKLILEWFDRWPDGNYGIATAGLVAYDIDPRHGGHLWLEEYEHQLPVTWRFRTGSGGWHILFRAPAGHPIGNRGGVAPGVDVRGDGGQIVGPGSIHPDGGQYLIEIGPDDVDLAQAPEWLVGLAEQASGSGQAGAADGLKDEAIPAGVRNQTLTSLCGHLFKIYPEPKVRDELHRINAERCNPTLPPDEVNRIVNSIAGRAAGRYCKTAPNGELDHPGDPFAVWPAPPVPFGVLPGVIDAYAAREARAKGVPFHAPVMAALAVCAAAIPDHMVVRVKVHDHWHERACLWVALIGEPSAKKSPTIRAATAPLKWLEKKEHARWREFKADWDKADRKDRAEAPIQRRYILIDATIEAAGKLFAENPHGMLLERDELAGWFGVMDKYSGGRGAAADRAFWLQAWNGGPYAVDRVSRDSTYIDNLSVSILGGIQPDAIRRVAADTVDDGLLQRLIPISVESAGVGEDSPNLDDSFGEYAALIGRLADLNKQTIVFDCPAQEVRRSFERYAHEQVELMEILSHQLAAFCGKLDGLFARLALTFHCCESQPPADAISEDTARRVERLMHDFIIPHARRFYLDVVGETSTMADARNIAGFILSKTVERVTIGRLTRDCWPCRKRSRDEVIRMLEPLELFGWLTRDDIICPRAWTVNPAVHNVFAKKAAEERDRRARLRDLMADNFAERRKTIKEDPR